MSNRQPRRGSVSHPAVELGKMPDDAPELFEKSQRIADTLLATAERFYLLARRATDRQAIETLLGLAEECEQRVEELQDRGET